MEGKAKNAAAALRMLVELFPNCFAWNNHRPLKIGIRQDIAARGVALNVARVGLRRYCIQIAYLHALIEGATRIDLDGQPAGVVTAEEAAAAAKAYAAMLEVALRKRALQREQAKQQRKAAGAPAVKPAAKPTALPSPAALRVSLDALRAAGRLRRESG